MGQDALDITKYSHKLLKMLIQKFFTMQLIISNLINKILLNLSRSSGVNTTPFGGGEDIDGNRIFDSLNASAISISNDGNSGGGFSESTPKSTIVERRCSSNSSNN